MGNNNSVNSRWYKIFVNKYFIAGFLFLAWISFFDENSFMLHQKNARRLKELQIQKKYYIERIAADREKLEDLNKGVQELERFAREQYFMAKPDEDVFIIVEEN